MIPVAVAQVQSRTEGSGEGCSESCVESDRERGAVATRSPHVADETPAALAGALDQQSSCMLDHQSAVAVGVSYVDAASVQYLVVAIMFSAPAVGVVAFFAQTAGASAQCDVNWTPVVQSSERFVVRGGEIPFAAIKPFTLLHLALLVATLAGLAVFTVMAWTSPHYRVRYNDGNIDTAILEDQIRKNVEHMHNLLL